MTYNSMRTIWLMLVLVALPAAAQAQWGDLTGRFVYDGKAPAAPKLAVTKDQEVCGKHPLVDESLLVSPDGGIANVVIYVRTKNVKVNPEYDATATEKLTYDNKNCRFEPHIMAIRLSQTLELHNSDAVGHNSNLQPLGDQAVNPLIPAAGKIDYKFNRAQTIPVPITCNIHPWMKGYILPRDNPYTAISGEDGKFTLKNLPVGKLEFQVWQEKAGYVDTPQWKKGKFEMEIKPGENNLGDIKLPAKLFSK